jgi:hypothetical protein
MKTVIAVALLVMVAVTGYAAGSSTEKPLYKIFRLTRNQVAISCADGADPTLYPKRTGQDALIITCGE